MDIAEIIITIVVIIISIILIVLGWIFVLKPLLAIPLFYVICALIIGIFFLIKYRRNIHHYFSNWKKNSENLKQKKAAANKEKHEALQEHIERLVEDIALILKAVDSEKTIEIDILENLEITLAEIEDLLQDITMTDRNRRDVKSSYKKFHILKKIILKRKYTSETLIHYIKIIDSRFSEVTHKYGKWFLF